VVAPLATRFIERLLAGHEPPLTVNQFLALRAIEREGTSGQDLARQAGVSGPAVSQLLAGLAGVGLIERHPVPADRRRLALELTPAGELALRSAEALLGQRLRALLADLPHPEIDALARALRRLEASLAGTAPPPRPPRRHPPGVRPGPPPRPPA
jgi:DNA-binding MarR family transcriptional regulator